MGRDHMKITVQPLREEALKAGFAAMLDRLPHGYSFELFKEMLADWRIDAFHDGERAVGMLMTRGPELHVAVLPQVRGKWLSRRLIRQVFKPILEQHGHAETLVMDDNRIGLDFVRRIRAGFADLRFDPATVAMNIGGSLLSGALQGGAAEDAAGQAAGAANRATDVQLQMFNRQNEQQAPYRQAGQTALRELLAGFANPNPAAQTLDQIRQSNFDNYNRTLIDKYGSGTPTLVRGDPRYADQVNALDATSQQQFQTQGAGPQQNGSVAPGYFAHQFNADDLKTSLAPNYQFQLQQGLGATRNAANLQTGLLSGNTIKGMNDYAQNFAGNAYQQAFSNYTQNQSNIFNRLSNLAGFGSGANQQSASLAGSMSPGIAGAITGAGAAQAAGTMGAANAYAGAGGNALGWYSLKDIMNMPTGGGSNYNSAGTFQPYYNGTGSQGDYQYG